MSKPGSECVVAVPSFGDGLEFVNVSGDLTFGDIEVNAGPRTKLWDYVQERDYVLNGVGDECAVVTVPLASQF